MSSRSILAAVLVACNLGQLFGCAGTMAGLSHKSPDQLQSEPTGDIAQAYGWERRMPFGSPAKLQAELERRKAFTPEQWADIQAGRIGVGDPSEVVLAAWGPPTRTSTHAEVGNTYHLWFYQGDTYFPHGWVTMQTGQVVSITQ